MKYFTNEVDPHDYWHIFEEQEGEMVVGKCGVKLASEIALEGEDVEEDRVCEGCRA